jgi:hypothetical protein
MRHQLVAALVCLVDVLTLLLFVRLCRHYVLKAVLLELLYDDRHAEWHMRVNEPSAMISSSVMGRYCPSALPRPHAQKTDRPLIPEAIE